MEEKTDQKNYLIITAVILAFLLIIGAVLVRNKDVLVSQVKSKKSQLSQGGIQREKAQTKNQNPKIDIEDWPKIGKAEAKVVMIEYADFACPFCAKFHEQTFPLIKRDYIDKGKILFVYKDFIVVGGERAAQAAHCAREQGKFWEYHDRLFSRNTQDRLKWEDSQIHREYAKDLGLDENAFISCFESRRYQEKVLSSTQEALQNGAQGTPYFFINGTTIFGAQSYSSFQKVIDSALNKQK
jgi:protein-disulfide isomerase